ncbi:MAG: hypothetical protein IPO40_07790 [Fibrobacteres bacterium]|nr:hypothetical protein [Fibrobacterota bacterium]
MPDSPLPFGLYEHILSNDLTESLARLSAEDVEIQIQQLKDKEDPSVYEHHLATAITRAFAGVRDSEARLQLANRLINVLASEGRGVDSAVSLPVHLAKHGEVNIELCAVLTPKIQKQNESNEGCLKGLFSLIRKY